MTALSNAQRLIELAKATKDAKKAASKANQARLAKLAESTREARWSPVMIEAMDKWEAALKSGDMVNAARYNAVAMRINRMITGIKSTRREGAARTGERRSGQWTVAINGTQYIGTVNDCVNLWRNHIKPGTKPTQINANEYLADHPDFAANFGKYQPELN